MSVKKAARIGEGGKGQSRFYRTPMLFLKTERLADDAEKWRYELKFDGYRAIAF